LRLATLDFVTAAPKKKLATYEDLLALPDGVKAELIDGEIIIHSSSDPRVAALPAPLPEHSRVQGGLRRFLGGPFDDDDGFGGVGGWWILAEVEIRLGGQIVRPDVAGWRRERLASPWGLRPIEIIPDWICEVVSPSNASHDRVTKKHLYAKHGIAHYWIADTEEVTLETFTLHDAVWTASGAFTRGGVARIEPFEAIELDVGRLFPPPAPPPPAPPPP
jgi:Uma2 family endonuclease